MGLLSHKISLQVLQKSIARILEMEGEKKNREGVTPGLQHFFFLCPALPQPREGACLLLPSQHVPSHLLPFLAIQASDY